MMFWNGGGWVWWQVLLMWIGMIGFWALIIWAVYALFTSFTRRPDQRHRPASPRLLDERLARGDVDADDTGGCGI